MSPELIQSIKYSIKHWKEDILNPLIMGRPIVIIHGLIRWADTGSVVPYYADSCPLCQHMFIMHNYIKCSACPLMSCGNESVWIKFLDNPCIETAMGMIDRLKSLLPEE